MIIDCHMHMGDFPMFGVSVDAAEPLAEGQARGAAPPSTLVWQGIVIDFGAATDVAAPSPCVDPETSGLPAHSRTGEPAECVDHYRVRCGSDTSFHHPSGVLTRVRASDLPMDLTDPSPQPAARCCHSGNASTGTSHDVVGSGKAGSLGFRLIGPRRAPRRTDRHSHRSRRSSNA